MDKTYFRVPNSIFEAGLTKYEMIVLIYLLYCQEDKQAVLPSYQKIARYCAISRSKARRVVNGLIEKDIIRKHIWSQSYRKNCSDGGIIFFKDNGVSRSNAAI